MKISINGSGQIATGDVDVIVEHIAQADADGFHGYWLQQSGLIDALTVLAVAATRTTRIELGTAVIPTFPQHPVTLAAQALTAQAISGGRINLGIGLSHRTTVETRFGLTYERPIRNLLDYLDILEPLLATGSVDHHGEVWSSTADFSRPTPDAPAVYVAALGEQTLKVCARRTRGTVVWLAGPRTIAEHLAPILHAAAVEADVTSPQIVAALPVVVTDDETATRNRLSTMLAAQGALPSYRSLLDRERADGPGDVAIVGDEAAVRRQISAMFDAGATEFCAVEVGANTDEVTRTRAVLRALNGAS